MSSFTYESFRQIKIEHTFTGAINDGANGSVITLSDIPTLDIGEFIYEVFYREGASTLTSGDTAGTYLQVGIAIDDADAALNATDGVLDTITANTNGLKLNPAYTKCTVDGRAIELTPLGTDDITGGDIEIILTIARCDLEVIDGENYYGFPNKEV
jgi:hypothetical protein